MQVGGQPGQKIHETSSQPMAEHSGLHLSSSYAGSINRKIEVQGGPGIMQDPISKITKARRENSLSGRTPAWQA
jgi:hypothetical protein